MFKYMYIKSNLKSKRKICFSKASLMRDNGDQRFNMSMENCKLAVCHQRHYLVLYLVYALDHDVM